MTVSNGTLQNGKRRMDIVSDAELTTLDNIITNGKPVKKRKYTKSEPKPFDPSKSSYSIINLTPEDDDKLFKNIIQDPIRGYFYYEKLGFQLASSFRYFTKKSGLFCSPKYIKHLKFQSWDEFIENFRLTAEDRETLKNNTQFFDIFEIAHSVIKYRRVLIEFLNSIYIGYTEGIAQMNSRVSQSLIPSTSKYSTQHSKNINIHYYKILCDEFNSFFDFNTGLGNTLNTFITKESLYISNGNDLNVKDTKNSLKWTAEEKDVFYEALARYSINRVDEISVLLPNKSTADVMNLYDALRKELKRYKSDNSLKRKLIPYDDLPISYEMSEEYIEIEEKFANSIEQLDEEKSNTLPAEYNDVYYDAMESRCNELFDFTHLKKISKILNDLENVKREEFHANDNDPPNDEIQSNYIVDNAMFDLYNIVKDFTFELIQRLLIKKVNKLSISQQLEWVNWLKVFEKPNDPKKMVRILDSTNMNKTVDEDIDYFDSSSSSSSSSSYSSSLSSSDDNSDDSSDDNNFYPAFTEKEYRIINESDPNGIEIDQKLDMWRLGISKKDVQEVGQELLKEKGSADKLYKQLSGKIILNSILYRGDHAKMDGNAAFESVSENFEIDGINNENIINDRRRRHDDGADDLSMEEMDNDDYKDEDYDADSYDGDNDYDEVEDDDDTDSDGEDGGSQHEDISDNLSESDEDLEFETFENNQNIDDLPSDSEINAFIDRRKETKTKKKNNINQDNNNLEFTYKWHDKEFVIADTQNPNKAHNSHIYTGLDLTVKGNEYLQELCDAEEVKLDNKDYMDSLKYENIYLTQLTSFNHANGSNSNEFADVFSNVKVGNSTTTKDSWRQVTGGPPSLFANKEIESNLRSLINRIALKKQSKNYQVQDEELDEFKFTFNDY